jgi:predicted nucleotidyltransferase
VITDIAAILRALTGQGARFILVGGAAAVGHGSARLTQDVDVVYARDADDIRRIVAALAPFKPYPRGAPPGLPFQWDERTLRNGLNFTLQTEIGAIDLLGEIAGGGGYADLVTHSFEIVVYGVACRMLSLEKLIAVKRAAGRPKDFEVIAELEAILARQRGGG